ncbi:5-guanidino-2-oxopentanoate decarboxylase [Maribius pontilimi]|uniref:5-guanidino-2-oxopentanoate decarboxylase n=1 Tax=Palleronia pontilimi TaxID=1964209 RepID=A0A934IM70_9RHOB|nr:5-guanidino-2-oxopentanoate decarboxylase [Palleronia pontilimi]MBJ3764594.1 5-guanidino-2-oxopentanoate decarboxylase [Palleronia pontilimi]
MPTTGEVLPQLIEAMGIDTIFGIPGVHTVELYRGLPQTGLRHVTPRHEQGAGFMADGYARASGRPAACFIISGPGMTNIATAMGQAYADSVPMLVVSSVLARAHLGRGEGRLHELRDQSSLVSGVAAFSQTVMDPAALAPILSRAAATFSSARPRPVHVELPLDIITAEGSPGAITAPPAKPAPCPDAIDRAANAIRAATRPLVIFGGGLAGDPDAARALAEAIGAPVVPTINGKGLLPPGHPLLVGSLLPERPVLDELTAADVVLALGSELGETDTLLFGGYPEISDTLIRVDIDPDQMTRTAPADIAILSDAAAAARALADALGSPAQTDGAQRTTTLRQAALDGLDPSYLAHGRIFDRIAKAFPGVLIAGDSTQPVYGANLTYDPAQPRSWFNSATGFGTLGYGLPAAFGAKLGCPDRPVMSLIGDGGIQFTLPELATAVELKLPVPVLLWNNRGYGEIASYMRDRDIPEIGVHIHTPDFQMLARGFGARATTATTLDDLIAALESAFAASGPTVIEIDDDHARHW